MRRTRNACIDIVNRGGNYGWDSREGAHCFEPMSGCQTAGLIDPVAVYGRAMGFSVTGGYVYRGTQTTEQIGRHLFADFGSGMIASLTPGAGGTYTLAPLAQPGATPPACRRSRAISSMPPARS